MQTIDLEPWVGTMIRTLWLNTTENGVLVDPQFGLTKEELNELEANHILLNIC